MEAAGPAPEAGALGPAAAEPPVGPVAAEAPAVMSAGAAARLRKEIRALEENPPAGIRFVDAETSGNTWRLGASIAGPEGSPFEGGAFLLEMRFPPSYPFRPPNVMFRSLVFHPNVSEQGTICMDTLYDRKVWSPANGIETVLISVQSLLADVNPEHGLNGHALELYNFNRDRYIKVARQMTRTHASDMSVDASDEQQPEADDAMHECVEDEEEGESSMQVCYVCMSGPRCVVRASAAAPDWRQGAVCSHRDHWTCSDCAARMYRCPVCREQYRPEPKREAIEDLYLWDPHYETYAALRRAFLERAAAGTLHRRPAAAVCRLLGRRRQLFHCPCGGVMEKVRRRAGTTLCDSCLGHVCGHARTDTTWWQCNRSTAGSNSSHPEGCNVSVHCEIELRSMAEGRPGAGAAGATAAAAGRVR
eukprot:TRINITY_DN8055_c0_g2_i1.p1 TRINITY_DN8055_c0_g2~~TRINITY_DN8055_c0_g2_i1.p1  ORF type:complete len:439 (+),score=62.97 TRINITY_DN8055_c0_g2_i1:61-1317(+)